MNHSLLLLLLLLLCVESLWCLVPFFSFFFFVFRVFLDSGSPEDLAPSTRHLAPRISSLRTLNWETEERFTRVEIPVETIRRGRSWSSVLGRRTLTRLTSTPPPDGPTSGAHLVRIPETTHIHLPRRNRRVTSTRWDILFHQEGGQDYGWGRQKSE